MLTHCHFFYSDFGSACVCMCVCCKLPLSDSRAPYGFPFSQLCVKFMSSMRELHCALRMCNCRHRYTHTCSSLVELGLDCTRRSTECSSSVVPHCTANVDLEISLRFPSVWFSFKYEAVILPLCEQMLVLHFIFQQIVPYMSPTFIQ